MALMLSDTVNEGRAKKGTIGGLVKSFLRMRFDCKDKENLRIDAGWSFIFLALGLASADERRMIRAAEERDPKSDSEHTKRLIEDRNATCEIVEATADLGYYLTNARDLWYMGGEYQRYAAAKERARSKIEQLTKILDSLPLDTRR